MFSTGDKVKHPQFGIGTVLSALPESVIVQFEKDGLQNCPLGDVEAVIGIEDAIKKANTYDSDSVIAKTQSTIIQAINNKWGVFSRSAIDLLPHQLWVCNQVLKEWPVRYLVADDVGLGKTIEAGLIMWSLIASKKIERILILTPAPLTYQWLERLDAQFDLTFDVYESQNGTSQVNYWKGHNHVIVSFPTVALNHNNIQEKILESEAWDLVIVDEAHHMNAEDNEGRTLQYQFFERLQKAGKVISTVFFTGTPHRGFDFGFWSLMKLVAPDAFDPKLPSKEQYKILSKYFIRNNKANTVDMNGNKLFQPIKQFPETFSYYPEEKEFYEQMSRFILNGKAYANTLSGKICSQVQLVLIALQKLASSSITAVNSALETRRRTLLRLQDKENSDETAMSDFISAMMGEDEEDPKSKDLSFYLMEDEIKNLESLIELGNKIKHESRIDKIIEIIKSKYPTESILFFTEYKKTQALLMKELMKNWGEDCVTFINGDEKLGEVEFPNGNIKPLSIKRTQASELFNNGKKRFLISTEAAGEGIDLQKNCHVLIHVDLPWNPMRLHQRVGRINRYGQTQSVDVISLRNPDTVESLIWNTLENKLENIKEAFAAGMDDPEDMLQLVLGMQKTDYFTEVFSEGLSINKNNFNSWFDSKTKTFGGDSAISTVSQLVGNAAKFNISGLPDVPKTDLPDLQSFFKRIIRMKGKQLIYENDSYSFITPEDWTKGVYGVKPRYKGLLFRRKTNEGEDTKNICGCGHYIFNKCLECADHINLSAACIEGSKSYFLYKLYDQKTYSKEMITKEYIVVEYDSKTNRAVLLNLDSALKTINSLKATSSAEAWLDNIPGDVANIASDQLSKLSYSLPQKELQMVLCGQK